MPKRNSASQNQTVQENSLTIKEEPNAIPSDDNCEDLDDSAIDYEDPYKNAENVGKGSFLFDFLRHIHVGTDLFRVAMPAHILEQRSFLEKLTDFNSHPFLLLAANQSTNAEERFLNICRWYLSGWHRLPKVGVKKPYNPIFGEIFKCSWEHSDTSTTTYFAEQVSHHPPVSAFFMENKHHQITVEGSAKPTASFRGQTATMNLDGEAWIHLGVYGETYKMTFPDVLVRGIIWGTLCVDTVGNTKITCPSTGYSASFEFTKKKEVKGTIYLNNLPVYKIHGDVHGVINIQNSKGGKKQRVFVDIGNLETVRKTVTPTKQQEQHESRRTWLPLTMALEEKDYDKASREKSVIEDRERALRRHDETEEKVCQPRHFKYKGSSDSNNSNNSDDFDNNVRWRCVSRLTQKEDKEGSSDSSTKH